jgi:hypothetical protein
VEKIQYDGEGVEISMKCDRETLSRIKQLPGILLRIDDKVKPCKELVL